MPSITCLFSEAIAVTVAKPSSAFTSRGIFPIHGLADFGGIEGAFPNEWQITGYQAFVKDGDDYSLLTDTDGETIYDNAFNLGYWTGEKWLVAGFLEDGASSAIKLYVLDQTAESGIDESAPALNAPLSFASADFAGSSLVGSLGASSLGGNSCAFQLFFSAIDNYIIEATELGFTNYQAFQLTGLDTPFFPSTYRLYVSTNYYQLAVNTPNGQTLAIIRYVKTTAPAPFNFDITDIVFTDAEINSNILGFSYSIGCSSNSFILVLSNCPSSFGNTRVIELAYDCSSYKEYVLSGLSDVETLIIDGGLRMLKEATDSDPVFFGYSYDINDYPSTWLLESSMGTPEPANIKIGDVVKLPCFTPCIPHMIKRDY